MNGCIFKGRSPIYLNPSADSEYADEGLCGMIYSVDDESGDFYHITMEYGYKGYLLKSDFKALVHAEWANTRNAFVIAPSADLLPEPRYRGPSRLTVPRGTYVLAHFNKQSEGFIPVELVDGTVGYMRSEWLRDKNTLTNREEVAVRQAIIKDAQSYLGTIYKWGGKTPQGIDCSGLTFMAYWLNGLLLYRDAKLVAGIGARPIPTEAIQPADLLYYPGHITLYLGDQLYIHSKGGSGGVVVNHMDLSHPLCTPISNGDLLAVGSCFTQEVQE